MDFLKKEYPTISNLYFSYINGEEYRQLKATKYINKVIAKATEKAQMELSDNIVNACCDCEAAGFILGFSYALGLMQESKVNCFEKNSSVYKETAKGCVK